MHYRQILAVLVVAVLLGPVGVFGESHGFVKEGLTMESEILGKEVRYTVYLPFDYQSSHRWYPVVYLLHGYTDSDFGWIQFGEAHLIADRAIAAGEIPPMILVLPDGGVSWYIDNYDGSVQYGTFLTEEFIPHIESEYRIRRARQFRGIAGLSMGGYGALTQTLKHPELFGACAAFSPGVYTRDEIVALPDDRWDRIESVVYGPELRGDDRLTDHLLAHNPIHLIRTGAHPDLSGTRFYIDCGDDDFLYNGNSTLHIQLREQGIPHEYRVRDGGHRWSYWRSGLVDGLRFLGEGFHRP